LFFWKWLFIALQKIYYILGGDTLPQKKDVQALINRVKPKKCSFSQKFNLAILAKCVFRIFMSKSLLDENTT